MKRIATLLATGVIALSMSGIAIAKETSAKNIRRAPLVDMCFGRRALARAECVHQFRKNKNVGKKMIYQRIMIENASSSSSSSSTSSSSSSSGY